MVSLLVGFDNHVIHVYFEHVSDFSSEYFVHHPL
ncbi:hypothetical protein A2U01_0101266, partial [Trifolium medium]|nr:hypothetical protein [Trifolium medium]